MLIYQGTKSDFMHSMDHDTLASQIETIIYEKMHRKTPRSEFTSWENSMQYMYKVLNDNTIPSNSGVAIEYNIPLTAKRVDFIISGLNEDNDGSVVIIELKQWSEINLIDGKDGLVETYVGKGLRKMVHPSYQAWSYCTMIKDYNSNVQDNSIELSPCAYLHNYVKTENDPIENVVYQEYLDAAPVFAKGDIDKLREFINKFIKQGDNKDILYLIDNGSIRPSKSLQDSLASMINGNKEFVMLDEQKVIYEEVLEISKKCKADGKKRVCIIKGGPGTGKSVVAVNLLVELTRNNQFCQYVSKNSAPRNVYIAKLAGIMKKVNINNMFKGSGSYTETPINLIDTLIVDEAHRLNEKSGMFSNKGENQIKEIINTAKCSVFFIDEYQKISLKDIGSIEEIKEWAKEADAEIFEGELLSQFRCNGSDGYLAWIDNLLGIRETANFSLAGIDYDFQVIDDAEDMRDRIIELNEPYNRARVLAGYCWEWPKKEQSNPDYNDIVIGTFKMSWNLGNTTTFAIDKNSVYEAGCIHTSQGLDFDYVGVIIGKDLRYVDGHIVTDFTERANTDATLKGIKTMAKADPDKAQNVADPIIRNTYRTLLTRGMKGCYVYCEDEGLRNYFKEMMK